MAIQNSTRASVTRQYHVYTLTDPRTEVVRYVGVTYHITRRYREHLRDARRGRKCHRSCWIRQLGAAGLVPKQHVIDTVAWAEREAAERRWIAHYRGLGTPLTNLTDGGDGFAGLPAEIVERIASLNRGRRHSDEAKRLIGNASRGKPRSEEVRAKIASKHLGKRLSTEHRAKLAASKLGKKMAPQSDEHRERIAEGLRKVWARRKGQ